MQQPRRVLRRQLSSRASFAAVLTAVVVGALALMGSAASAAPPSPFTGTYWSIDQGDGSLQQLTFGAGGAMFYRDSSVSFCGGVVGLSTDTGTVSLDGQTWTGSGVATFRCPETKMGFGNVQWTFALHSDGSLSDLFGFHWTRSSP